MSMTTLEMAATTLVHMQPKSKVIAYFFEPRTEELPIIDKVFGDERLSISELREMGEVVVDALVSLFGGNPDAVTDEDYFNHLAVGYKFSILVLKEWANPMYESISGDDFCINMLRRARRSGVDRADLSELRRRLLLEFRGIQSIAIGKDEEWDLEEVELNLLDALKRAVCHKDTLAERLDLAASISASIPNTQLLQMLASFNIEIEEDVNEDYLLELREELRDELVHYTPKLLREITVTEMSTSIKEELVPNPVKGLKVINRPTKMEVEDTGIVTGSLEPDFKDQDLTYDGPTTDDEEVSDKELLPEEMADIEADEDDGRPK